MSTPVPPLTERITAQLTEATNIKDATVFNTELDIRPELFVERPQSDALVAAMGDFLRDGYRRHQIIIGMRGSGKTHTVRFTLRQFHAVVAAAHPTLLFDTYYVNCLYANTSFKVAKALVGVNPRDRQIGEFGALQLLAHRFEGNPSPAVLVLDEVDMLLDFKFLYGVVRDPAFSHVLLVCITKTPLFFKRLPDDVKSALPHDIVAFDTFTAEQLNAILTKRAEAGLHQFDPKMLLKIAVLNVRSAHSDARAGIRLLPSLFRKPPPGWNWPAAAVEQLEGQLQREYLEIKSIAIRQLSDVKLTVLYWCMKARQSNKAYADYAKSVYRPISRAWFFHTVDELVYADLLGAQRTGAYKVIRFSELVGDRNVALVEELVKTRALIRDFRDGADALPPDEETLMANDS